MELVRFHAGAQRLAVAARVLGLAGRELAIAGWPDGQPRSGPAAELPAEVSFNVDGIQSNDLRMRAVLRPD